MTANITVTSAAQLNTLLQSSRIVVVNFENEWNGACKAIVPVYNRLASQIGKPGKVQFATVNAETNSEIAQAYNVSTPPTFIIFKNSQQVKKISGPNAQELSDAVKRLAIESESDGSSGGFGEASSSSSGDWRGAGLPRGYTDVTDQVDVRGLDLLNADSDFGGVRTLFDKSRPSTLAIGKGKGAATGSESKKDWVETDVDEQLMLYVPFTSTLKIHTIQITSSPPSNEDDEDAPLRPKTIRLFTNRQHNLGFEEAEDIPATQEIELKASDWDESTNTAKLELRFVKFQNVYSIVLFVVDGDGDGEKTRIDRLRFIGESGEKREMGKLEKIGDDS